MNSRQIPPTQPPALHSIPTSDLEHLRGLIPQAMLRDQHPLRSHLRKLQQRLQRDPSGEESFLRLLERAEASAQLRSERESLCPRIAVPDDLPIALHAEEIQAHLQSHQVLVVAGETGSGKTTQLPKLCWEAGFGRKARIACTQPRRVAATSIARQVAKELETEVGDLVGYRIRFSEKTSPRTLVQFMTDGMLLAETQRDRFLNAYDAIIVDEAHERSLNVDFLLGYLQQLLPKRPDLRVVITSASIDTRRFAEAFGNAPVVEVSGRAYPVEVQWQPLDPRAEESGERTVADAVVETVREVLDTTWEGDLLVFLPGEQEIREATERLSGGSGKREVEILPLYGRLTAAEQNRVFRENSRRKVVIATNIAETSLTIPGIRYVVDSGLQRVSRYSPRQRIQRLPVELIAQSNALQRAGRAGRIAPGVCIRLYAEETFAQLREYAEPEILRSNLAGVILQMLHLKLGDPNASGVERIRNFPFLDPPAVPAIKEGFRLLRELGAVDAEHRLTPRGRQMAKLPIEPTIARMLLEAHEERAMTEVLVIAAGLSIQDPREFPLEKKEQARQQHRVFVNPESDFLTLLNIWNAFHDEWEALRSENKLRKFCKAHFLSFVRMREWRDIHRQLEGILRDAKLLVRNEQPADYRAVHCCLLSGLLSQIAQKDEKSKYRTGGGKEVFVFPGSGLHGKAGPWVLAGEQVETTRLYARKVANIDVRWLESLGGDLCRKSYSNPRFDEEAGIVQADEKVTLHGLPIVPRRSMAYGRVNPAEATQLFIREGLVEERLRANLPFFRNNRKLRQRLVSEDAKVRRNREFAFDAAAEEFYTERLRNVASIHDLNRVLKQKRAEDAKDFLVMRETDLLEQADEQQPEVEAFPDYLTVGTTRLQLHYAFAPGEERDGATLRIHDVVVPHLRAPLLDWLVPGQWEERIQHLLRALPKAQRKQFVPIPDTAKRLAALLKPDEEDFLNALSRVVHKEFGVRVAPQEWDWERVPDFLKPRIELRDNRNRMVAQGREVEQLLQERQTALKEIAQTQAQDRQLAVLETAQAEWNLDQLSGWSCGELPERIELDSLAGIPIFAFPGFLKDENGVHRRLFATQEEAQEQTAPALRELLALAVGPDLAWLEKDLADLRDLRDALSPFGTVAECKEDIREAVHTFLFDGPWIKAEAEFQARAKAAAVKLRNLSPRVVEVVESLLLDHAATRQALHKLALSRGKDGVAELEQHLRMLMPKRLARHVPYVRWPDLHRYLRALRIRAERMALDPVKDADKRAQLEPWPDVLRQLQHTELSKVEQQRFDEFRWMLEELRVSVFAPEVRTAFPISAKRMERFAKQHFERHLLALEAA